jgi:hypothetical protein
VDDIINLLSKIIFVTIISTIVLSIVSYGIYKVREAQRPRRPIRDWTLPDEADGDFHPILFERVTLDDAYTVSTPAIPPEA